MMELEVRIRKQLEDFRLDVTLEAGGAPLALLGASGCGKSVTLRCIAGLMKPDEGYIALDGRVLFDSEQGIDLSPQERRIGYLFQHYALFPHMTVRQNIAAAVWDRETRNRVAEERLRQFHLEDVADRRPHQISGGQQQRTALARIMASRPGAILLDEPLSALDSYLRFQLELELSDILSRFDGPVIWVSHDRGEVYRNCRYVCVLENGQSQEIVTVPGLLMHPGTEGAARLAGCRNYADAIPRENAVFLPLWGITLRCAYPLPPFMFRVGFRSRHVRMSAPGLVNAFDVTVKKVIEDVNSTIILLHPVGADPEAPPIQMEMEKSEWQGVEDKRNLTVSVGPQDILLLRK